MRLKSKALKLFLSVVMSIFLVPGIAAAAAPTFTSAAMDHAYGDNYVRLLVVFSEGVCGDSGGTTPITKEDFVLSVKTNGGYITGASINNIMNSSNNNPEPGDTHFFFNVDLVGGPQEPVMITQAV